MGHSCSSGKWSSLMITNTLDSACFPLVGKSTVVRSTAFTECCIPLPPSLPLFWALPLRIPLLFWPFHSFSPWREEEMSRRKCFVLCRIYSQASPWVRPQVDPPGRGCCVELPFSSSCIADNQLGPSSCPPSTFLNWNLWMFPCHSRSTSGSSDQSELEADTQALTDQY